MILRAAICTMVLLVAGNAAAASLHLSSPAFREHEAVPIKYTCQGADISPPIAWSGVPAAARSLALVIDDPDAPDPATPRMTWVHWVVYDIPPATSGFGENAAVTGLPSGTHEGRNSWHKTTYGGPCPPIGRHRYFFKLYALDVLLDPRSAPTEQALDAAMQGHVLAKDTLIGTYRKTR